MTRFLWSGLAVLAGALAVLSLPPFSVLAFVPISYGSLFLLVQGTPPRVRFWQVGFSAWATSWQGFHGSRKASSWMRSASVPSQFLRSLD